MATLMRERCLDGQTLPPLSRAHPCAGCEVRGLSVCGVLAEHELKRLRAGTDVVELPADKTIVHEGDPSEHLYSVTAGSLRLSKLLPDGRRQITGFLFKGDFLGITVHDSHAYSVETLEPSRLCRFGREHFETMTGHFPHLEHRLYHMAAHELAAAQAQMVILGRKTPKERLASFLLSLTHRAASQGDDPRHLHLSMRRGDIADFLGLTKETVSRTFTQFKTGGLLRLHSQDDIELLDPERLRAQAEGLIDA